MARTGWTGRLPQHRVAAVTPRDACRLLLALLETPSAPREHNHFDHQLRRFCSQNFEIGAVDVYLIDMCNTVCYFSNVMALYVRVSGCYMLWLCV